MENPGVLLAGTVCLLIVLAVFTFFEIRRDRRFRKNIRPVEQETTNLLQLVQQQHKQKFGRANTELTAALQDKRH